jgi:redox-sensitive bicupin YhaK (pirin superfamily)
MQSWDLQTLEVQPHQPEVLESEQEGRLIAIELPAGEMLQEHQVHERAWLVVVRGKVEVLDADGGSLDAGPGTLAAFDPNERPWPGEGHPSQA